MYYKFAICYIVICEKISYHAYANAPTMLRASAIHLKSNMCKMCYFFCFFLFLVMLILLLVCVQTRGISQ